MHENPGLHLTGIPIFIQRSSKGYTELWQVMCHINEQKVATYRKIRNSKFQFVTKRVPSQLVVSWFDLALLSPSEQLLFHLVIWRETSAI